jgi:hypothetical protein
LAIKVAEYRINIANVQLGETKRGETRVPEGSNEKLRESNNDQAQSKGPLQRMEVRKRQMEKQLEQLDEQLHQVKEGSRQKEDGQSRDS